MIGDVADMARRLAAMLPSGWFSSAPPILSGLLSGIGAAWSALFGLIQSVIAEARLATATGSFLDLASVDFFGGALPRRVQESDNAFRGRIGQELLRARGTRAALAAALTELTGQAPVIFEPAQPADTGGYSVGGVGYGVAGGWGSLLLPFQFFVTAHRPLGGGIAQFAGYGSGGVPAYGSMAMVLTQVSDADIATVTTQLLPAATIAWLRLA